MVSYLRITYLTVKYVFPVWSLKSHKYFNIHNVFSRSSYHWSSKYYYSCFCYLHQKLCFCSVVMFSEMQIHWNGVLFSPRRFNLSYLMRYAHLLDEELDEVVRQLVGENEEIRAKAVRARLAAMGVRVQRRRVRESLIRVNLAGAVHRALSQLLQWRSYSVAGPNSLWHIDGNHKLIR